LSPSDWIHFGSESPLTIIYFNVSLLTAPPATSFFNRGVISLRSDGTLNHNLSRDIPPLAYHVPLLLLESRRIALDSFAVVVVFQLDIGMHVRLLDSFIDVYFVVVNVFSA